MGLVKRWEECTGARCEKKKGACEMWEMWEMWEMREMWEMWEMWEMREMWACEMLDDSLLSVSLLGIQFDLPASWT